jgi:PTH1 family peptidyl-tRNA hydrolase
VKLVVGLGNPDGKYAGTRHNIGFEVVARLAERNGVVLDQKKFDGLFGRGRIGPQDVGILQPLTYMNLSGNAVAKALKFLPVEDVVTDLLVVMDDVDLPSGRLRLKAGGGAGGQRGLANIIQRVGRKDFMRLRFGIGRPPEYMDTADYVLQRFSRDENQELPNQIDDAAKAIETALNEGVDSAMNWVNR